MVARARFARAGRLRGGGPSGPGGSRLRREEGASLRSAGAAPSARGTERIIRSRVPVAQRIEHSPPKRGAGGSSPPGDAIPAWLGAHQAAATRLEHSAFIASSPGAWRSGQPRTRLTPPRARRPPSPVRQRSSSTARRRQTQPGSRAPREGEPNSRPTAPCHGRPSSAPHRRRAPRGAKRPAPAPKALPNRAKRGAPSRRRREPPRRRSRRPRRAQRGASPRSESRCGCSRR